MNFPMVTIKWQGPPGMRVPPLHATAACYCMLHMTSSHRCMHAAHVTPVTDALSHASLTLDDMQRPQTLYNTLSIGQTGIGGKFDFSDRVV